MIYNIYIILIFLVTSKLSKSTDENFINSSFYIDKKLIGKYDVTNNLFHRVLQLNNERNIKIDAYNCISNYNNHNLTVKCSYRYYYEAQSNDCHQGPPNPRIAWLISCLSNLLVQAGYQIPVYILTGGIKSSIRLPRILTFLKNANLTNIMIFRNKEIADINDKNRLMHFGKITDKDVVLSMGHEAITSYLHHCNLISNTSCYSNSSDPRLRYALVLEDDTYLPNSILQHLIEILLITPLDVELFYLDDSFHQFKDYLPPNHLLVNSPYTNIYQRNNSRTGGSYLLSYLLINKLYSNESHFIPYDRPQDSHMNDIIRSDHINTYWVIPPVTCHGSGLHGDPMNGLEANHNRKCHRLKKCCEMFYNMSTLSKYLQSIYLI